ncbi:MAG: hypothetical protein GY937_17030, partial [bacterium]|nr:hypothetical protein [bacterium]
MEEAFAKTQLRANTIRAAGYELVEMWECDLRSQLRSNKAMAAFFDNCGVVDPLNPRHGFYGGRTNATTLYRKCVDGEQIGYIDVCSLYPYICKYGEFPTGHPVVITEGFSDIRTYKGMVKGVVLPPQNLYHPVLPYRTDHKLTFPLCRTCADERDVWADCEHDEAERVLTGTWTTLELFKAMDLGYRIVKLYEIWHYPRWAQYPKGLFTDYIDCFFKIKLEASGYPRGATTDEARQAIVAKARQKEGIEPDESKIANNPGLCQIAKLSLNSFWGKFGQKSNLGELTYFPDTEKFFDLMRD